MRETVATYPLVRYALATCFNAQDGLLEDASQRMLSKMFNEKNHAAFAAELKAALADPEVSWRSMLCNSEYEVEDFDDEEQAKQFAQRNLLSSISKLRHA